MAWHPNGRQLTCVLLTGLSCWILPGFQAQSSFEDITVQCVIRDDRHRAVADLKPEELLITEDGKPVVLKSLKAVNGQAGTLAILVDSGSNESLTLGRDAMPELLAGVKDSAVPVSLWDVKQAALLRDFNVDRGGLGALIATGLHDSVKDRDTSARSKQILAAARRLMDEEHRSPALALLFALIEEQAAVPGRKEIVYFVPNGEESTLSEEQVTALGSNALRAGVSVYVIEAAGASAQVEAKAAALLTPQQRGANKNRAGEAPAIKQNMWRELARKSGGAYAAAGKDGGRETARRAGEDLGVAYQASYTPLAPTEDGHFRAVVVKVNRARTGSQNAAGYFSVPNADAYSVADYTPLLLQALHDSGDSDQLRFDSEVLRFGQQDGKTRVVLVVEVPRSSVTTLNNDTEKLLKVHFAVYAVIRGADGKIVSRFSGDMPYETASEKAAAAPKNLFTFERQTLLAAGDYRAEIAVGDQNSPSVGKRTFTFSIAKPAGALTLGDLIVVRGVEPRTAERGDDDPLAFGAQSLVPWVAGTVKARKGSELPVLLKVYGDPAAGILPDMQLEIHRGSDLVASLPLLVSGGTGGQFQALVWLPEESLEAGHYTLLAKAAQGQVSTERSREFEYVLPGGSSELAEADTGPDLAPKQLLTAGPELIAGAKKPSDEEIAAILQAARERALEYKKSLPNFSCLQTNKRFTSKTGVQNWKAKDSITELLRYADGKEEHQILEVNGVTKAADRGEVKGLLTKGEFGEFLDAVYSPDSHAEFTWQGRTLVDGQEAHVFAYKVKRVNSIYSMSTMDGRSRVVSAFHGIIHIDANTLVTRFVSIEAEDIPVQALYRESTVSVNYGYFTIEGQKCLLPKTAVLSVRVGKRSLSKDEMQFRNYRRYGATSNLITR